MATMYAFAAHAQRRRAALDRRNELGCRYLLPRARPRATCAVPRRATSDMSKAVEPAIAVDQLVKVYKTSTAVDGISFALEPGSITGLLGGNGAGKTTTIAMILGLVTPTSGTVRLASHNMAEVERLCERVIIMKKGRIEDDDPPHALLARYGRDTLEEVFLDVARGRGEAREA